MNPSLVGVEAATKWLRAELTTSHGTRAANRPVENHDSNPGMHASGGSGAAVRADVTPTRMPLSASMLSLGGFRGMVPNRLFP